MYAPGTAHAMGYDVPPLHAQARQHIQPRMSLPPGFLDRPGPSAPPQQEAAPGYRTTWPPAPPGQQGQTPEAAAFLSLDLEFYRASSEFSLMLGGLGGRRFLADVLIPYERDMAARIRSQLLEEQRRRDPNYLPPIMGRGSEIVERIGFTAADIARYQLNLQESLTFVTAGGVMRPYTVRLGLAKEGSFYFVVLVLLAPPPLPPTTPPGHAYYSHQPLIRRRQSVMQRPVSQHGAPPQRPLSQHGFPPQQPPRYAVRDPAPSRLLSEGPPPPTPGPGRLPPSMSAPLHHQPGPPGLGHTGAPAPAPTPAPAPSPQSSTPAPPRQGMMPPMPRPYSAVGGAPPPAPPAFQGPPLPQTPRSELPQPQPQPPPPPTWRLPPIRAPDEANTASTPSSRVDIPGLLHRGADAGPR